MIKGKWRIDLGGKIKGAKSVALGSAVTKRGQDNGLQMCERCKYPTGGGEAARRARGSGARQPSGGLGTPRRLSRMAAPSPVVVVVVGTGGMRETGCREAPGFKQGFRFWGAPSLSWFYPPSPTAAPLGP